MLTGGRGQSLWELKKGKDAVREMMKMGCSGVRHHHIQHTVEQVWRVSPDAFRGLRRLFKWEPSPGQ